MCPIFCSSNLIEIDDNRSVSRIMMRVQYSVSRASALPAVFLVLLGVLVTSLSAFGFGVSAIMLKARMKTIRAPRSVEVDKADAE